MFLLAEFEGEARHKLPLNAALDKLEHIRDELREVTANLHDSIQVIEGEPLGKIKSEAELKAEDLEVEVLRLREELRVIRELLGSNLENKKPDEKTL